MKGNPHDDDVLYAKSCQCISGETRNTLKIGLEYQTEGERVFFGGFDQNDDWEPDQKGGGFFFGFFLHDEFVSTFFGGNRRVKVWTCVCVCVWFED